MKYKPLPHQQYVLDKTIENKSAAWFLDPGLGKTFVTLRNAWEFFQRGEINALVVISHLAVVENWVLNEVPRHMGDGVRRLIAPASAQRYIDVMEYPGLVVLGIHKEALRNKRHYADLERFMKKRKCMLALDESTWCKNITAAQSRAVYKLGGHALYKRILTGTPAPNGPLDYFGQFRFLLPGIFGHGVMSKQQFIDRFCATRPVYYGGRQGREVTGWSQGGQQRFVELIKGHSIRITKDYAEKRWGLKMPKKIHTTMDIELPSDTMEAYLRLRKEEFLSLINPDGTMRAEVEAASVATALVKLHQLTSGWVKSVDGSIEILHGAKLAALQTILAAWGNEQVIIWAHFRQDVDMIARMLGNKCRHIYGGVSDEHRRSVLTGFREGTIQYLVANPASVGHGLTLTNASRVVYYSNSWNYEYRAQSEDRVHRIGQEQAEVTYVDLVVPGTVDEDIQKALERKESFQRPLLAYTGQQSSAQEDDAEESED